MDILLQDVRYAARKLVRTPGFTSIAVLTLALAIGATTAVFSIVNGVLLKPLPFPHPTELVAVGSLGREGRFSSMSPLDFIDYRDQSHSFEGMAAINTGTANLTAAGTQPQRLNAAWVGARFFDLLRVTPTLGRTFHPDDDTKGAARVAVLSDKTWRARFGADSRIVGQTISLDGNLYTVIGIVPASVTYPEHPDVWLPLKFESWMVDPSNRGAHFLSGIGRMKPGVSTEAASRDVASVAERLSKQFPESNAEFRGGVKPLSDQIIGDVGRALYIMLGAVGFVLLIACANVANLLLVRAAGRETELAVRTALGAGRGRIVRQLITESLLLSVGGALAGGAVAAWAVDAVVAFAPRGLPRLDDIRIDGRVLLFSAAVAVLTGVLFGLIPALHAARGELGQMLRESVRGSSGRRGAQRTRNMLVVSEVALAVVLLVGAGLLIRSFVKLVNVDPGFRTEHIVSFSVTTPDLKYPYDRDRNRFAAQVIDRLAAMPGTQATAVSFDRPLQHRGMRITFEIDGRPASKTDSRMVAGTRPASASYFSALGIRLVRGRLYTREEESFTAPPVLVINETLARKFFPNDDPIGKHITLGIGHDTAQNGTNVTTKGEIVGIVADAKLLDLATPVFPDVYVPFGVLPLNDMNFFVRSAAPTSSVTAAIRSAMHEIDPEMPVYDVNTMDEMVSQSVAQPRFYMTLLGAFAVLALLLAALGIYGVISYVVSQRTRELGIRIALGATRERVVRLVLNQGLALTAAGVVIGLVGSYWVTRLITKLLFGVTSADPLTFAAVAVVLVGAASLASYIPALRASRVDPVVAMRAE
jgi:putative ABC transport system permease protein